MSLKFLYSGPSFTKNLSFILKFKEREREREREREKRKQRRVSTKLTVDEQWNQEDEGQEKPRGRGTTIELMAQTNTLFSVMKKNLHINRVLCAIKIKEENLVVFDVSQIISMKILCNVAYKPKMKKEKKESEIIINWCVKLCK